VSWYQKGKTNLHFTEARDSGINWAVCTMQVCTLLQTDNHASTPTQFFTGRMPFLPPNQQRQSTEGKKSSISADRNPQQQQKRQEQYNNVSYEIFYHVSLG